jgi:amino acid adenylation domain-containing protein
VSGLHGRFLRGLALDPDAVAVRLGERELTYRQLHEKALLWAGALLRAVDRPRAIGLLANKSETAYVGALAALYTGAALVPLHPDFPVARTRQVVEAAGVSVLIADSAGSDFGLPVVDSPAGPPLGAPVPVAPEDTAYILFTSGSTGRPKGVPITHGATTAYLSVLESRYDFGPADVFSQTFDLTFDCAMFDLFTAWGAGATLLGIPPNAYRDLPAFVRDQGVTVWFSTPSTIGLARRTAGLEPGSMPSLRWSFFAGEALQAEDAQDWQLAASRSTVENLYGPTELTVTITGYRWSPSSPGECVNGVVPIGEVHSGHDHLLLGPDPDEGELCVTGPQLTPGYLDPADDEGRFLEHDGRRWYRTGDRVRRLPGGGLAYLGRADAQVQIQGWRVELAEIDHAVRGTGLVAEAVTVTVPGAHGLELVVFYTGAEVPPVRFATLLRETLPAALIPRRYRWLEELPLNANRKTDRGALKALTGAH